MKRREAPSARELAPRLARAYDQVVAERGYRSLHRRWLTTEILETERLIAHRELQQLRAGRTNKRKYVNERASKLADARDRLGRHRERLRQVDETPVCCLLERGYSQ